MFHTYCQHFQISWSRTYYCSAYRVGPPNSTAGDYSQCAVVPSGFNYSRSLSCLEPSNINHTFIAERSGFRKLGDEVKMRWIWCLFLILIIPEGITVLVSFWQVRTELKDKKDSGTVLKTLTLGMDMINIKAHIPRKIRVLC